MKFCESIFHDFKAVSNTTLAIPMEKYMKNKFVFLGIKTEQRRTIFKTKYLAHEIEIKSNFRNIAWELFNMKEREFHIFAIDLLVKEFKKTTLLKIFISLKNL